MLALRKQNFSTLSLFRKAVYDSLNRNDPLNPHYQVCQTPTNQPLKNFTSKTIELQQQNYELTVLQNGIKVLTESASSPSNVHIGILQEMGTRDETLETSGSLLNIKNTYMKTVLNTNETVNYGMVQMAGGTFFMDYDQERTYYKANCLNYDVVDIFNMMADCALEPRSVTAASVGMAKSKGSHNIQKQFLEADYISNEIFRGAYGLKGLGMPLKGLKHNLDNLNAYTLQKFQLDNIRPDKISVCANGVESHQEFVELVNSKLGGIQQTGQQSKRESTQYLGGEIRNLNDSNELHLSMVFQSLPYTNSNFFALKLAEIILNSQNGRIQKNLIQKHYFIDNGKALNASFSDSGLFGIQVSAHSDQGNKTLELVSNQLKGLNKIDKNELQVAKALLINQIMQAMERSEDRLEESIKNVALFGQVQINNYAQNIEKVTAEQVSKAISGIISGKPTVVALGGSVSNLHSFDKIQNLLIQ